MIDNNALNYPVYTAPEYHLYSGVDEPWNEYPKKRPKKYGKYLVKLINAKIKSEIWNGTGFAYNNEDVILWK